ncbi:aromatic ring-hydroxylating dioxygenase subunit alpha [Sphingopyxis sp.]|uniref:aromatic ring-hydroxylating oxygenase subunit alpha n=1 Tax=Sphingopyxis sp. TaxID=1908224 RepID=UPI002D78C81A|nr:aromatic ring-hydroxylating dioxygenase subunit alpha [Sphingopyxis sp.]HET6522884.1 aromatic ring-hydroxylating dioxygenase subunit alpha [Sphingopyxis sp.]
MCAATASTILRPESEAAQARAEYRRGYSLPQYYYSTTDSFDRDIARLRETMWFMAGHESQVPNPGDYKIFEIAGESIILCRDTEGKVHAFYNVCRHRGSPICVANEGNAKAFVCPYHSWTYLLDGTLKRPRAMDRTFVPKDWNLKPVHLGNLEGLLFVCLAQGDAPEFEEYAGRIRPFIRQYGIKASKAAYVQDDLIETNWKLPLENFRENYHISTVHKDLGRVMGGAMELSNGETLTERLERLGRQLPMVYDEPGAPYLQQAIQFMIGQGFRSASMDGQPVSKLMSDFTEWSEAWTYVNFSPLSHVNMFDDFTIMIFFTPISAFQTKTSMVFLVADDAEEGRDYDVKKLTELLTITMGEDNVVLERHQKGINSSAYEPCPVALEEEQVTLFHDWYFNNVVDPARA